MWKSREGREERRRDGEVAENKSHVVEGWSAERDYNKHLEGCMENGTGSQTKTCKWMFTALLNNSQRVGTQCPSANE